MAQDQDRLPVVLMASLPPLGWHVAVGFLRFQSRRKKGVRRFRRALIAGGLSREQASRLAEAYHEAGSIREILRGVGRPQRA